MSTDRFAPVKSEKAKSTTISPPVTTDAKRKRTCHPECASLSTNAAAMAADAPL